MASVLLLIDALIQILGGIILRIVKIGNDKIRKIISFILVMCSSVFTIVLLFTLKEETFTLIHFTSSMTIGFKLDGLGKIFAGLVSFLWPFSLLYSFVYMEHEERKEIYNAYYVMTYGVVLGICFSSNLITMYFFYECLTLVTLPLIIHPLTKEAKRAGRFYLYYSITGSSLALIGIITLAVKGGTTDFIVGGYLSSSYGWAYLLSFLGFGVKAAIFPLNYWLPTASVAPTPTTALLHAVAVVKAGAFAIIRVTYYAFDYTSLKGTWVQTVCIVIASVTIIYGSSMALKEQHFKRRLAYSTVANLSYIILGAAMFSKAGLIAAMLHFIIHSVTKIGLFFDCGAIINTSGAHYVYELNGLGKKMPWAFNLFLIASLSLTGIPLFGGFVSKWYLCSAALDMSSTWLGILAILALLISALLTAMYTIGLVIRSYVYEPEEKYIGIYNNAKDISKRYIAIISVFALLCIVLGVCASWIVDLFSSLLGGIL